MEEKTLSKFDRQFAGLQGGNNLPVKPATIEHVEFTGEAETYIVQTIRAEYHTKSGTKTGDYLVIKVVDGEGTKRIILPPKATETIARQRVALDKKSVALLRAKRSAASMHTSSASG